MSWQEHISVDAAVLVGKPVIKGTRIAVELVLDLLAAGQDEAAIRASYPGITDDDIRACVAYAADIVRSERVFPAAS
jgi:uncharacterized protein (DUF433 family)